MILITNVRERADSVFECYGMVSTFGRSQKLYNPDLLDDDIDKNEFVLPKRYFVLHFGSS